MLVRAFLFDLADGSMLMSNSGDYELLYWTLADGPDGDGRWGAPIGESSLSFCCTPLSVQ